MEARNENKEFFLAQVTGEQFPQHTSPASSTHTRSGCAEFQDVSGDRVMTLMVMNDVDTPSHKTNSLRDSTNIPKNIPKV